MSLTVSKGDKITVRYSPYVWTVVQLRNQHGNIVVRRQPGRTSSFAPTDVLSIVERAKSADDYRRLAEEA